MKPVLRIDFCDFPGFNKADNFLIRILSHRFDVQVIDKPDIVIFSDKGNQHRLHTCPRVFYTGEALRPDFRSCDYGLTCFPPVDGRSLRLPYYVQVIDDPAVLIKQPGQAKSVPPTKTEFCAFAVSYGHRKTRNRIDFFHRLSRYKKVNSCGKVCNNIGGPIPTGRPSKMEFIGRHKFMICFENALHPGYVTEKIADAMEARCIPIYWGAPEVAQDFNPKSFVNVSDFPSPDHAIQRIVEIDNDPELYRSMLAEPYFHGNRPSPAFDPERVCDFFQKILENRNPPLGSSGLRKFFGNWNRWTLVKRDRLR